MGLAALLAMFPALASAQTPEVPEIEPTVITEPAAPTDDEGDVGMSVFVLVGVAAFTALIIATVSATRRTDDD